MLYRLTVQQRQTVAIVAADELESLMETAHLPRSPKTAERLLGALARARAGATGPMSFETLTEAVGVDD